MTTNPKEHFIIKGDYAFFHGGCFSQWWPSKFMVENFTFNCCEQYMMFKKAMLFGDIKSAAEIMEESSPRNIKFIGRRVRNFDNYIWDQTKRDVVYKGNYYKFTENEDLKEILLSTGNKVLVEASPKDIIWGIGLSVNDENVEDKNCWRGTNYLGYELTRLKFKLMS